MFTKAQISPLIPIVKDSPQPHYTTKIQIRRKTNMDLKLKNSTCSCGCLSRLSELCGEFKQSHHRLGSWIKVAAINSFIFITLILFLIISNLSGCYRNLKPEKIEETEYGSCLIDDEFIQETNSRAYIVNDTVVVILTETDKVDVFDMTAYRILSNV